jgi:hypothetical protein
MRQTGALKAHCCAFTNRFFVNEGTAMPKPRFEPRSFSAEPKSFGRAARMLWNPIEEDASEAHRDRAAAARNQHRFAIAIRKAAIERNRTVEDYADVIGQKFGRFNSILNGSAIMRLEDVANAERNLGLKLIP